MNARIRILIGRTDGGGAGTELFAFKLIRMNFFGKIQVIFVLKKNNEIVRRR
jgi:hypothetical protein